MPTRTARVLIHNGEQRVFPSMIDCSWALGFDSGSIEGNALTQCKPALPAALTKPLSLNSAARFHMGVRTFLFITFNGCHFLWKHPIWWSFCWGLNPGSAQLWIQARAKSSKLHRNLFIFSKIMEALAIPAGIRILFTRGPEDNSCFNSISLWIAKNRVVFFPNVLNLNFKAIKDPSGTQSK